MRTVRASELGSFLYCRRAWWLRKQGVEPTNKTELAAGTEYHQQQGGLVVKASLLHAAGWVLIFLAAVLLAVTFTLMLLE